MVLSQKTNGAGSERRKLVSGAASSLQAFHFLKSNSTLCLPKTKMMNLDFLDTPLQSNKDEAIIKDYDLTAERQQFVMPPSNVPFLNLLP